MMVAGLSGVGVEWLSGFCEVFGGGCEVVARVR